MESAARIVVGIDKNSGSENSVLIFLVFLLFFYLNGVLFLLSSSHAFNFTWKSAHLSGKGACSTYLPRKKLKAKSKKSNLKSQASGMYPDHLWLLIFCFWTFAFGLFKLLNDQQLICFCVNIRYNWKLLVFCAKAKKKLLTPYWVRILTWENHVYSFTLLFLHRKKKM